LGHVPQRRREILAQDNFPMFQAGAFLALAVASGVAFAADNWSVEVAGGTAHNLRNRLKIEQDGGFSESLNASYDTRAFRSPPYYMLRAAHWQGDAAWEVSQIHHKLYLTNPPAGVTGLSVSHGLNIISVNRAFRRGDWIYRFGAGPVITHAEATILQTKYDGPYRLSGAAVLAGLGRRYYFSSSTYLGVEGAVTAAYATPKMSGSPQVQLTIRNTALHFLVGVGHEF
jgi:hypothetical protein